MHLQAQVGVRLAAGQGGPRHGVGVRGNPVGAHPAQPAQVDSARGVLRAHQRHHCSVQLIELVKLEVYWLVQHFKNELGGRAGKGVGHLRPQRQEAGQLGGELRAIVDPIVVVRVD
jgi:hypothetical protein